MTTHLESAQDLALLLGPREADIMRLFWTHGPATVEALVMPVYGPTLDAKLVSAAARSLTAHLIKLEAEGVAQRDGAMWRRA